jgi:hypothetical protein
MSITYGGDTIVDSNGGVFRPSSSVMRNRIINGAMVIDQRNAGASVTFNDGVFPVDRFRGNSNISNKCSGQQSTDVPAGFKNSLLITSTSAYSVAAGEIMSFYQGVEGLNIADLGWGTANAQTVTLSFWVKSSLTGSFGGCLKNSAGNRSYPFLYTISAANTWTQISITIPGDTTGTWLTTNGIGIYVQFGLGVGSTYSGTAGAWASANYVSVTGATSVIGTSGATFYITGVQLEVGSSATGFEYRQYGQELALCQRYYQALPFQAGYFATGAAITAAAVRGVLIKLDQTMRANPTITLPAAGTGAGQMYFTSATGTTPTTVGTNAALRATVNSFQIEGDGYLSSFTSGNGIALTCVAPGITITANAEL